MIRKVGLFAIVVIFMCTGFAAAEISGAPKIGAAGDSLIHGGKTPGKIGEIQEKKKQAIRASFAKLPLSFIKNEGQKDKSILFYEQGSGHATAFTGTGISLFLARSGKMKTGGAGELVTLTPLNASSFTVQALDKREGKVNYFVGKDVRNWKTDIPTYGAVLFKGVYPGIDMKFYGSNSQLEYDMIVAADADPSRIKLSCEGIERLSLTPEGELEIALKSGSIIQKKPFIYQVKEGKRTEVSGKFVLVDATTYGFEVGPYERNLPLVIDPALLYSTYLGGASNDVANAIAVDTDGNAYVAGSTMSTNFPVLGPFQLSNNGGSDAFITKLGPSGNTLLYSTYLGGASNDVANAIAVDTSGNAYVAGSTMSTDFPVFGSFRVSNSGGSDAFITKLGPAGDVLVYSIYLGGSQDDFANAIAVDSSGSAYVAGSTVSPNDFPVLGPFQFLNAGGSDAFITKIAPAGNAFLYSSYLGGSQDDFAYAVAVDSSGSAYVAGATTSTLFPVSFSAFQLHYGGGFDGFITKIAPAGNVFLYSSYLGGSNEDKAKAIAVDSQGNAYVAGYTLSTDFPVLFPYQLTNKGGSDAFVTKINPSGTALLYSTYIGGFTEDKANAVAVDSLGSAYVAGSTTSTNFPVVSPVQLFNLGGSDAFVATFDPSGTNLVYSTYLGGNFNDFANAIAVDSSGNAYVAGTTNSTNFPRMGPFQPSNAGGFDAFVTKISPSSSVPTLVVTKTGTGTGTVLSTPSGINCGSACSAVFTKGTAVTLTASAGTDSVFAGWSGGGCSGSGSCVVTVVGKITVTAKFVPSMYTITASVRGGHGSANPTTQKVSYLASASVDMTPDAGYYILSIKDNAKSVPIVDPYVINNVSANHNVVVRFTTNYTLTVEATGTGIVTSSPSGINCGSTCSAAFAQGTKVNLVPAPPNGFVFTGWTGACKGTGVCSVTMNGDKTVGATFVAGSCTYAVSPKSKKFTYKGGTVTVRITAKDFTYCPPPEIVNNTTWITNTVAVLTKNRGSVKLSASPLDISAGRADSLTIGGNVFGVSQTGVPCTLSLTPVSSILHPAAGDTGAFNVEATPNDCQWSAVPGATSDWVTISSGATGTGNGTVNYSVAPNGTGRARNGKIAVTLSLSNKSKTFKVKQGNQ